MVLKGNVYKDILVISFAGEIDDNKAERIRSDLDSMIGSSEALSVVFDMSKVTFMDSTGIGIILGRYKRLKAVNVPLYIMNPNLACDKLFTLSGLYRVIKKIGNLSEIKE